MYPGQVKNMKMVVLDLFGQNVTYFRSNLEIISSNGMVVRHDTAESGLNIKNLYFDLQEGSIIHQVLQWE